MKNTAAILLLMVLSVSVASAEITDSATVHFHQGKSDIDTAFMDNSIELPGLVNKLRKIENDTNLTIKRIRVSGAASPEGPVALNYRLSEQRARAIYDYVSYYYSIPDSIINFRYVGRDWKGLLNVVKEDPNIPDHDEVEEMVSEIASVATPSTEGDYRAIQKLKRIGNGDAYRYLYSRLYPSLRKSGMTVEYLYQPYIKLDDPLYSATVPSQNFIAIEEMAYGRFRECRSFYMGLKTNMLYDALLLPNLGAEFYVGRNLSVGGNWMYGWWDKDDRHRYWRAYGGDIYLRWWFGSQARNKPLTGHHIGLFGGVLTYDFEFGNRGYMGGLPGQSLWNRCNRFAGIEYGYSLPVTRRLNIDFSVGVGYFGGKYIKYVPRNEEYVWQSTHKLKWFGPVKAEVSLVWLIGCDNYNRKGGMR